VIESQGKLRVATPDLSRLVALFDHDDTEPEQRFMTAQLEMVGLSVRNSERPLFIMNTYFHAWGHQFLYDRHTLESALESVGFRDVRFLGHQESDDPELRNIERHIEVIGGDIDNYVTMIVQASK
jgi:predicted SAM-dependent methyltransferase